MGSKHSFFYLYLRNRSCVDAERVSKNAKDIRRHLIDLGAVLKRKWRDRICLTDSKEVRLNIGLNLQIVLADLLSLTCVNDIVLLNIIKQFQFITE